MPAADVLAVVGFVLLAVGLALWSIPLALVVVGGLLLVGGLWSHSMTGRPPAPPAPETTDSPS